MTNALTWTIKPIRLRINSNLLSVISLFVICTMVFMAASAIAYHCYEIRKSLALLVAAELVAIAAGKFAFEFWKAACVTGNPWTIIAASAALAIATAAAVAAGVAIVACIEKLAECEKSMKVPAAAVPAGLE